MRHDIASFPWSIAHPSTHVTPRRMSPPHGLVRCRANSFLPCPDMDDRCDGLRMGIPPFPSREAAAKRRAHWLSTGGVMTAGNPSPLFRAYSFSAEEYLIHWPGSATPGPGILWSVVPPLNGEGASHVAAHKPRGAVGAWTQAKTRGTIKWLARAALIANVDPP